MKRSLFLIILVMLLAFDTHAAAVENPSAAELFSQVEARFDRLNSLSYQVKRIASSSKQRSEDQWQFRYRKPDMTRIDYHLPQERVLYFDGATLVEYLPTAKKALKTEVSTLSAEQRSATLQGAFSRVALPGLRLGDYAEMSRRATSVKPVRWEGVDAYLVEGANPRYAVYIDLKRRVLLRTEIYDQNGKLAMRADGSDFTEVSRDFWLPREIKSTYGTASGFLNTTIKLSKIQVDEPIAVEVFRFQTPTGVTFVTH